MMASSSSASGGGGSEEGTHILKVASFNIQKFGIRKAIHDKIMEILAKIVSRYDIIFIMELVGESTRPIEKLVERANSEATVHLIGFYECVNSELDEFHRPPFCILVEPKGDHENFILKRFFLIGFHSRPKDIRTEIRHVGTVFDNVVVEFGCEMGLILGDLNTGCRIFPRKDYAELKKELANFDWFPDYGVQTDTSTTDHCSFNRIFVPKKMQSFLVSSPGPFYFDLEKRFASFKFGSPEGLNVKDISDHYPIECAIRVVKKKK